MSASRSSKAKRRARRATGTAEEIADARELLQSTELGDPLDDYPCSDLHPSEHRHKHGIPVALPSGRLP